MSPESSNLLANARLLCNLSSVHKQGCIYVSHDATRQRIFQSIAYILIIQEIRQNKLMGVDQ